LIAPERFLVLRASSKECLRCVQTRRVLVRSLADFATRRRTHRLSEKLHPNCQKRFTGFPGHVLIAQHRPPNSKTKFKSHRSDRVRRKR
jgi:hypothetical protein